MLDDTFTERAATDNLLFSRRRFFETDAGLSVQFPYGTLHNDIEIFPDDGRIRMRQLLCCCDAHCIDLFRDATSDTPDFPDQLNGLNFLCTNLVTPG